MSPSVKVQLLLGVIVTCLLIDCPRVCGDEYDDEDDREYQPARQERPQGRGGLIDVDVRKTGYGGKHVGVHVPVFYKMDLDKDPYGGGKGLGINVLEGLVKVRVKKDPYAIKDNVFVSLAGIPLWMQ